MSDRYFVEEANGLMPRRYFVLHGKTVVAIQSSCPDGKEVERPRGVVFAIRRAVGDPSPVRNTMHFNNQTADSIKRARNNAGKKLVKWSAINKKKNVRAKAA